MLLRRRLNHGNGLIQLIEADAAGVDEMQAGTYCEVGDQPTPPLFFIA